MRTSYIPNVPTDDSTLTRLSIAALVFTMVNAVLFGAGAIAVLSIDALARNAEYLLPLVVAVSLIAAAPLSWAIAPRLRARFWRRRRGDLISGPIRIDEYSEQIRIW